MEAKVPSINEPEDEHERRARDIMVEEEDEVVCSVLGSSRNASPPPPSNYAKHSTNYRQKCKRLGNLLPVKQLGCPRLLLLSRWGEGMAAKCQEPCNFPSTLLSRNLFLTLWQNARPLAHVIIHFFFLPKCKPTFLQTRNNKQTFV